jgi:DNA-binding CsgD family transcriptional regulator
VSRPRRVGFRFAGREFLVVSYEPNLPAELAPAEREIARAILAGKPNAEIARERGTSPRTVANQVASIFRRLGVGSRAELVERLTAGSRR